MDKYYEWFKVAHIISFVCWMAGMFYLPRLFVYHTEVEIGSKQDYLFQKMEVNLLKRIINPAMILTIFFGLALVHIYGLYNLGLWFIFKTIIVFVMIGIHGFLAKCRKNFILGKNKYTGKFYRILNEVPPLLMVLIVILVIIKPFE